MLDKRYACIDVGLKRIGFCICVMGVSVAKQAVIRKNRNQAAKDIKDLLDKYEIDELVVGVPLNEDSSDMQTRIEHFVSLIGFLNKIHYEDESFSSYEAKELTKGIMKHKRDGQIDSLSAKIIFDRWFCRQNK